MRLSIAFTLLALGALTSCSSDAPAEEIEGGPPGPTGSSTNPGDPPPVDAGATLSDASGRGRDARGTTPPDGSTPPPDRMPPPDTGAVTVVDSGTQVDSPSATTTYGQMYQGGEFHLGPVDWDETQWHNACAPGTKYAPAIRQAEGSLLVGLWNGIANVAGYCDACVRVTTAMGKTAVLRVVTYGETTTNSIDVSPDAYQILNTGEYPRSMTWQFAKCPDTGKIVYEFQTEANEWWTSLWVRNGRVPITKVEVKSVNHANYTALERGSDGTLTDGSGFGNGPFSIRLTGIDNQQIVDDFAWPAAGIASQTLPSQGNFQ